MKVKNFFIVSIFFLLVGCNEKYSHEYLLQHPSVVKKELTACRKEKEYTSYCDMVKHTADEFEALTQVCMQNPEAFGKQILFTQMMQAKAKENLDRLQQQYEQLQKQNQPVEVDSFKSKMLQAKQEYQNLTQKVKTLYAVVASLSMEQLA